MVVVINAIQKLGSDRARNVAGCISNGEFTKVEIAFRKMLSAESRRVAMLVIHCIDST
jgi:hypothetical protein